MSSRLLPVRDCGSRPASRPPVAACWLQAPLQNIPLSPTSRCCPSLLRSFCCCGSSVTVQLPYFNETVKTAAVAAAATDSSLSSSSSPSPYAPLPPARRYEAILAQADALAQAIREHPAQLERLVALTTDLCGYTQPIAYCLPTNLLSGCLAPYWLTWPMDCFLVA